VFESDLIELAPCPACGSTVYTGDMFGRQMLDGSVVLAAVLLLEREAPCETREILPGARSPDGQFAPGLVPGTL
jgi:hypothetical protein